MPRPSALLIGFALLAAASAPAPIQSGRWEVTVHPNAIPLPHALDAEAGNAFRAMMTQPEVTRVCLKKIDLAELKPLFAGGGHRSCAPSNLTLADGTVTANGQCTESGRAFAATIAGKYTATSFDYSVKRISVGLDRAGTVAMTASAKRIGDC